jgi:hypothetical protein
MRFALAALLAVHGLLHLIGFVRPWGLASPRGPATQSAPALNPAEARAVGVLWLLACVAMLAAAALVLRGRAGWWVPAAAGLALSQALIIGAWSQARVGTLVNLLVLVPVVVAAAQGRFHRESEQAVLRLFDRVPAAAPKVVTREEIAPLPAPVRRWLEGSGVVGRERARVVRLRQRGWMRTSADQPWMAVEARQYFTVDQPAFVWMVDVVMKHVPVVGRDSYQDGHGRMLIKAGGLITVADGAGDRTDQGTLLRFLGEIVWFPSAALAPYIRWEALDDASAKATMSYGGVTASAVFTFDDAGRVMLTTADRYMGAGPQSTLQRWEIPVRAWRSLGGVLMPVEGSATWKLPAGDFDYFRWEITEVEVNHAELYRRGPSAPGPGPEAAPRQPVALGDFASAER